MQDNKTLKYIHDVLENMPTDWLNLTTHRLDIFNEKSVKYQTKEATLYAFLDKTQLIRIVTNLVKNALQATENEENPFINIEVISEGNTIKIIVSDNGKGISDEVKDLIFEPKFTTKSSGMGLGLPMIKNII